MNCYSNLINFLINFLPGFNNDESLNNMILNYYSYKNLISPLVNFMHDASHLILTFFCSI